MEFLFIIIFFIILAMLVLISTNTTESIIKNTFLYIITFLMNLILLQNASWQSEYILVYTSFAITKLIFFMSIAFYLRKIKKYNNNNFLETSQKLEDLKKDIEKLKRQSN